MRRLVLAAPLFALACTSANPAYEGGVPSGTEGPATDTGTRPGDTTETSTGATTGQASVGTHTGADTTSASNLTGGTTECGPVAIRPIHDNFLKTNAPCGMDPCAGLNFGAVAREFVSGPGDGLVSYLLLSFDLNAYEMLDGGQLELRVHAPDRPMPFDLEVTAVFPGDWVEGAANGDPALRGTSSWMWSANPMEWMPEGGAPPGSFENVVNAGFALPLLTDLEVEGELDSIFVEIPNNVLTNPDSFGHLNLAITVRNDIFELEIDAREANANSPVLRFEACTTGPADT